VAQHHQVAVAAQAGSRVGDNAARGREHGITDLAGNVQPLVAAIGIGGQQLAA